MARYRSEVVESMLKDMGQIGRAFFSQSMTLVRLCRRLQEEVGKNPGLQNEQLKERLEGAFKAVKNALSYVNKQVDDLATARKKFIDAEGKLASIPLSISIGGLEWKAHVAADMRKAKMKDTDGVKRQDKINSQSPKNNDEVKILVQISDQKMDYVLDTRELYGSPEDNLDGLLFLLAPPGRPREGSTRLTYHPHFYKQSTVPNKVYDLLPHGKTIGSSLPLVILAHNKKGSPYLLLPRETLFGDGARNNDVVLTNLDSPTNSHFEQQATCHLQNSHTREPMDGPETRWTEFPYSRVREFDVLDYVLVINTPEPSLLSQPASPQGRSDSVDSFPQGSITSPPPEHESLQPSAPPPQGSFPSMLLIISTVIMVAAVVGYKCWGWK
ncbi:hypothetical protein FRC02_002679 [Tulasnella sp. 418]|nr:hypothetical protein FRC02_002679 [Tulasnella sp. 418]